MPASLVEPIDTIITDTVRLIEKYHNPAYGSMTRIGVSPCWLVYENEDVVRESRNIALQYQVSMHSHLADSRDEFTFCAERHGCTPVEYAEKMGYLQPGNFFAHCVQMTRNDFSLLAKNKVGVACCSNSDMILNSGVAKASEFMRRGIHFGIGVDGAASNNASNMIAEMKNAYLIQRFIDKETIITPEKILYMATVGGAKTLGRDDLGRLAPNMMADFVMLNWNQFQYSGGKYDPVSAIVLAGDARMVDRVYVDGKMVVEHGRLTQIDEEKTARFINEQTCQLNHRYNTTK